MREQQRVPKPIRSQLHKLGVTTLYRLGGQIVAPIPAPLVRQLGLLPGELVAWSDVGEGRLLVRRATVILHGSGTV